MGLDPNEEIKISLLKLPKLGRKCVENDLCEAQYNTFFPAVTFHQILLYIFLLFFLSSTNICLDFVQILKITCEGVAAYLISRLFLACLGIGTSL